jgi:large subunit ribosomal protein L46
MRQRLTPARDIGRYKGYGEEAWNDEVLVGAQESDFQWQVDRLLEDAEQTGTEGQSHGEGESGAEVQGKTATASAPGATGRGKKVEHEQVERPMSRVTEADQKGDVKSLNRLLQRTLYLLVKDKDGQWVFPQDTMERRETLHMVNYG